MIPGRYESIHLENLLSKRASCEELSDNIYVRVLHVDPRIIELNYGLMGHSLEHSNLAFDPFLSLWCSHQVINPDLVPGNLYSFSLIKGPVNRFKCAST